MRTLHLFDDADEEVELYLTNTDIKNTAAYSITNNAIRRGGANSKFKSGPAFRKNFNWVIEGETKNRPLL